MDERRPLLQTCLIFLSSDVTPRDLPTSGLPETPLRRPPFLRELPNVCKTKHLHRLRVDASAARSQGKIELIDQF